MKYVFPCIIEKNEELYSLKFPDLKTRKVFNSDLYNLLKTAHNILLIDLYIKEAQRMVIVDPTPFGKLKVKSGQVISYITCDTDVLVNMLDFYDNVQTDDLERFLQEKFEEAEAYETTVVVNKDAEKEEESEDKTDEKVTVPVISDSGEDELLDFEDDAVVVITPPDLNAKKEEREKSAQKTVSKSQTQRQHSNYRPRKKK